MKGRWTQEFYNPLEKLAKISKKEKLLAESIKRLKELLPNYDPYNLFLMDVGESRERARLDRKEFDESVERSVKHHFRYLSPEGFFHRFYNLHCVEKAGLRGLLDSLMHSDHIKHYMKKEGISSIREATDKIINLISKEGRKSPAPINVDKLCRELPIIKIIRTYRKRNYVVVEANENLLENRPYQRERNTLVVLKRESRIWKFFDDGPVYNKNDLIKRKKHWDRFTSGFNR